MIRVIATFQLQEDMIDVAKKIAEVLVSETRNEDGCIQYDLLQDNKDENHLVMIEHWETQEKLDAHSASEHFAKYVPMLAELCVKAPEVVTYKNLF
ncbi:putative quinol monooxygenase [Breznakia pachnodae]|jgi:quinol monooxygenase YgiN|uniref:Quinol monooxygenase YgiN n=1 Tax=Breznakia pachnodae TaxID=265178 RepID=A0ABU0E729_9FIRM|nr:putative quinol monooxygenase [Breznakia pachnodae]MDQ0362713.1 quinol monooxygenase YgiN [Breznakia pachnodae]